jgi:hypothetical protein
MREKVQEKVNDVNALIIYIHTKVHGGIFVVTVR